MEPNCRQIRRPGRDKLELSFGLWFDGQLPTHPDREGCQQVVQRVRLYIQIMLLLLLFDD
jgi:hypothetical protein